jgi:hypothetical protein
MFVGMQKMVVAVLTTSVIKALTSVSIVPVGDAKECCQECSIVVIAILPRKLSSLPLIVGIGRTCSSIGGVEDILSRSE